MWWCFMVLCHLDVFFSVGILGVMLEVLGDPNPLHFPLKWRVSNSRDVFENYQGSKTCHVNLNVNTLRSGFKPQLTQQFLSHQTHLNISNSLSLSLLQGSTFSPVSPSRYHHYHLHQGYDLIKLLCSKLLPKHYKQKIFSNFIRQKNIN